MLSFFFFFFKELCFRKKLLQEYYEDDEDGVLGEQAIENDDELFEYNLSHAIEQEALMSATFGQGNERKRVFDGENSLPHENEEPIIVKKKMIKKSSYFSDEEEEEEIEDG